MGYLKRVNRKRKARLWKKQYGSKQYRAFVVSLPCLVPGCRRRGIDPHHYPTKGAGGTWRDLTPLCAGFGGHHQEFHVVGQKTFQDWHNLDLKAAAEEITKQGGYLVEET